MENLKGVKIKQLDFDAEKRGDLLYHEGPLLSHFTDVSNENIHYLYKWCDCNDLFNRWLIIKVNKSDLLNFLYKSVSLKNLIEAHPYVFFIDIDNEMAHREVTIVALDDISEDYLPFEDSFYDEDLYEEYALVLGRKLAMPPVIQEYRRSEASTIEGIYSVTERFKNQGSYLHDKDYLGLLSYFKPQSHPFRHQTISGETVLYIKTNAGFFKVSSISMTDGSLRSVLKELEQHSNFSVESLV